MRAVVRDQYGDADAVRVGQVPLPSPAKGQVLVRVEAAGVDRGVVHLMTGRPYLMRLVFGLRRPRNPVLGGDLAGTVVAVGAGVTRFAVGDEVFGFGTGSFAEHAVADEDKLAHKPAQLSFAQAAVVPVSAATALQALDIAKVEPHQRVLVLGAAGGVGSFAVQLAKALGAEVTAVVSTAKQELARELGADHVLDYTVTDFAAQGRTYDVILDIAGNPGVARLRRALTPTGVAVLVGGEEGGSWTGGMDRQLRALAVSLVSRQRLSSFVATSRSSDLERLAELLVAGTVVPRVQASYPLEQAAEALRLVGDGSVRGKVALDIWSERSAAPDVRT
jgi:NADPH:quinone reductase-like Zn-dependent oxidoreductase